MLYTIVYIYYLYTIVYNYHIYITILYTRVKYYNDIL